jgi:hypothetical protein
MCYNIRVVKTQNKLNQKGVFKMNEFIITIKEEVTRERYATKEEILLCKKSILRDKIDKMIKGADIEEWSDKLQKLLMEEVSEDDICEKMKKMAFNEIDFDVKEEV